MQTSLCWALLLIYMFSWNVAMMQLWRKMRVKQIKHCIWLYQCDYPRNHSLHSGSNICGILILLTLKQHIFSCFLFKVIHFHRCLVSMSSTHKDQHKHISLFMICNSPLHTVWLVGSVAGPAISLISTNNCYSAGDKTISSSMQINYILNTEYWIYHLFPVWCCTQGQLWKVC